MYNERIREGYRQSVSRDRKLTPKYNAFCKQIAELDQKINEAFKAGHYNRRDNLSLERCARREVWQERQVMLTDAEAKAETAKRYGHLFKEEEPEAVPIEIRVAGVSYGSRQKALERLVAPRVGAWIETYSPWS